MTLIKVEALKIFTLQTAIIITMDKILKQYIIKNLHSLFKKKCSIEIFSVPKYKMFSYFRLI